jgi:hypothetical protein
MTDPEPTQNVNLTDMPVYALEALEREATRTGTTRLAYIRLILITRANRIIAREQRAAGKDTPQ